MNTVITPEIKVVMDAVHYRPAVSVIMPFEPKMKLKKELIQSLEIAADKVEEQLLESYPGEMGNLVIQKLKAIIKNLNFSTHKNSIAIYVSPVFEKVLYLDMEVEQRIVVDESFEIRDLVYNKKQILKYLVLVLSGKESRIYLGNSNNLVKIVSNAPESVYAYLNDVPERVANFSDMPERKEIMTNKFLHHIDNSLDIILNAYRLPLFVLAPEKIMGHFKKITRHMSAVIEYAHGNFDESTLDQLKEIVKPLIADWKMVRQKDLLNQIEKAADKKKLAMGMSDVWREATRKKGRLLVVEKNFKFVEQQENSDQIIHKAIKPYNTFSYIRDAVDDIIEKVLENGGDVEFVEEGMLSKFEQIVLIQYY